jgi:hypothetical protein
MRHWGKTVSQRLRGKSLLVEQSPVIKSFLNVRMARLVAFRRCTWGGASL